MDTQKMTISIKQRLLLLRQEANTYGRSQLLDYIDLDFIEKMEIEADAMPAFADAFNKMRPNLDKLEHDFTDVQAAMEVKNAYSEALVLCRLQARLHIDKIPEKSSKTPDYLALFRGNEIYVEIKSLNTIDPISKHKNTMSEALDKKIDAIDQMAAGASVAITEQVVDPYSAPNKPADPRSVCNVTERLIEKMNQNIKAGQFGLGESVLLIDLSDQLTLIATPEDAIQQFYENPLIDQEYRTQISGELWYAAFGQVGDGIYREPEFEGEEVEKETLQREGILVTHPYIKGLIIHHQGRFFGLAEHTKHNMDVVSFIGYSCDRASFK